MMSKTLWCLKGQNFPFLLSLYDYTAMDHVDICTESLDEITTLVYTVSSILYYS